MFRPILLAGLLISGLSSAAHAQTYSEMPEQPGVHIADYGSQSGWRVIGIGDREDSLCAAFKAKEGSFSPNPKVYGLTVGAIGLDNRDTVFLMRRPDAYNRTGASTPISLKIQGRYGFGNDRYEWRWQGDRFFTQLERGGVYGVTLQPLSLDTLSAHEGRSLETKSGSWEYPAARIGYSDDSGTLDLTGLSWVKIRIEACESALPAEFPSHYRGGVPSVAVPDAVAPITQVSLPDMPEGWRMTEFGNYMAFDADWLTILYRETKRGSQDALVLVDQTRFPKFRPSKMLELELLGRDRVLSSSRYARRNFGDTLVPFSTLRLSSDELDALRVGDIPVKAKFMKEKLEFPITDFAAAEAYWLAWRIANP